MSLSNIAFIDEVVRMYVHPQLKRLGFTRKARTWNKSGNTVVNVVNIQHGKENAAQSGSLTVNLGIFVPTVYQIFRGSSPPAFAQIADCVVTARLGFVETATDATWADGFDFWWNFDVETNTEEVGQDVAHRILVHGIPFLTHISTLAAVHDFLMQRINANNGLPQEYIYLAIIKALLKDIEGAYQLLDQTATKFDAWKEWAMVVSHRVTNNQG
jgi:hypothetical protein